MERKLLLLGMLTHSQMYGYQINEMIDTHLGTSVQLTKPTAYRFLNQLEDQGYIQSTEEQEGSRPVRRVYEITAEGELAFKQMLREGLARYSPSDSHTTIPIGFMDSLPPEDVLPLLKERRTSIEEMLKGMQVDEEHTGGFSFIISHQTRHLETEIDWLDGVIEHIKSKIA